MIAEANKTNLSVIALGLVLVVGAVFAGNMAVERGDRYLKNLSALREYDGAAAMENPMEVKTLLIEFVPEIGIKQMYPLAQVDDPESFTRGVLLPAWSRATAYQAYKNPEAQNSINYVLDESLKIKYDFAPPQKEEGGFDYEWLFGEQVQYYGEAQDLCTYAVENDIRAVVMWAGGVVRDGEFGGGFFESAVTGSKGVPTNGPRLTTCSEKTIVVYGLNYERGIAEALESYAHHAETVFRRYGTEYVEFSDEDDFYTNGQPNYYVDEVAEGVDSCGNVHNPPTARNEYDVSNVVEFETDCWDWRPDGSGEERILSCADWGCERAGWITMWLQSVPGLGNDLYFDGEKVPNWWVYIGDADRCVSDPWHCGDSAGGVLEPGTFGNMAGQLLEKQATFEFEYSEVNRQYRVHMSTVPDMSTDVYLTFAFGDASPLVVNDVQKWDKYTCGRDFYWRVEDDVTGQVSDIQSAIVDCNTSPSQGQIDSLKATLSESEAKFEFGHPSESGPYRVHMSTVPDMSTDVYLTFAFGDASPLVVNDVQKWDKYTCGRDFYWRVEDDNRASVSEIASVIVQCSTPSPVPTVAPTPVPTEVVTPIPTASPTVVASPAATSTPEPVVQRFGIFDDAYVSTLRPDKEYGTRRRLVVRKSESNELRTYLKFDVRVDGRVQKAELVLELLKGSGDGPKLFLVENTWDELRVNWNNQPNLLREIGNAGRMSRGEEYRYDVSEAVVGSGRYSFGLIADSSSGIRMESKERNAEIYLELAY
jgi:hypothetical protein